MAYTTINKSTDYFNTTLYDGNDTDNRAITGISFAPNCVWIKDRSNSNSHYLQDTVRGATKNLKVDGNDAEETRVSSIKSFTSDGWTMGTEAAVNANSQSFASWSWKANGSGSANTDGDINSTVSANTTSGFSIVTYTGTGSSATVGHGLGAAPGFITVKRLDTNDSWQTYHKSLGAGKFMQLNGTDAEATNNNRFGGTEPTTAVFSIGTDTGVNASGGTYVAYCWAEKTGYCKIGKYKSNDQDFPNSPFIYTGFKPQFIMFKNISTAANWVMTDDKRRTYNPTNKKLYPNSADAEVSDEIANLLSNGFKLDNSTGDLNASTHEYIYAAFGQSMVASNNIPCTAW